MDELITLSGTVENIIYKNAENGYTVFSLFCDRPEAVNLTIDDIADEKSIASDPDGDSTEVVCVGCIAQLNEGENLTVTGSFTEHAFYGRQFQMKKCERVMPDTTLGIEKYLGSGVIKGVGARLAKRIVDRFGKDTFSIIENNPVKLAEIKGITKEKALAIAETHLKNLELKSVMVFLQGIGVGNTKAIKIYKEYKENTLAIVKSNPYKIADDVFGIGFHTADEIADKVGVDKNSIYRIKAGIKYTLSHWAQSGHTFMPRDILFDKCAALLGISLTEIGGALSELQIESQIVQKLYGDIEVVYLSYYFNAENNCAKRLASLALSSKKNVIENIDEKIEDFEKEYEVNLAEEQKEAVKQAAAQNVLVITGGPGTGKTTSINAVISVLKRDGKEIVLAAPTGRAAKRMTEATGYEAKTIHRLLQMTFLDELSAHQKFERDENNPIECDVIIIDEASMVDIMLLHSLLKAVPREAKLILVGDVDQLPSVGAGSVLRDIIKSGCVAVVSLTEIFRQAQKSAIVMNAHRINKGTMPVFNGEGTDFFFLERKTPENVIKTVEELITRRLPQYLDTKSPAEIQVLTPMRKSVLGVNELNKLLRHRINPASPDKNECEIRDSIFRVGDKVMQIKNNYNITWVTKNENGRITDEGTGIFNGDQGKIADIDEDGGLITVLFDDGKTVCYEYSQTDELELAYSITIHKSQGSEYPAVIIPILSGPHMLMTRNLLYTAVTRAKKLVAIVGSQEKIAEMVNNNMEVLRYSALKDRLKEAFMFYK